MGNLLYIIAVILVIIWAVGFLGYGSGGIIHILLVIAIVVVLLRVIRGGSGVWWISPALGHSHMISNFCKLIRSLYNPLGRYLADLCVYYNNLNQQAHGIQKKQ